MTYTSGIPASGQTLGSSRLQILNNFSSLKTTIDQDHVDMNDTGPGRHKQTTFSAFQAPGAQTNPQSVLYTAAGTADSSAPQLFWKNQNATFHYPIKAWGLLPSSGSGVPAQSYNIESANNTSKGQWSIVLTPNAVKSSVFAVLANSIYAQAPDNTNTVCTANNFAYDGSNRGTFTVTITFQDDSTAVAAAVWSFIILQI